MIPLSGVVLISTLVVAGSSYFAYNAGHNAAEVAYHDQQEAQTRAIKELSDRNYKLALELDKVRAQKQEVITKVVREVRRELIAQPVRDCGWTTPERVSLHTAYCANFPEAPSCLPSTVPSSAKSPPGE